MNIHTGENRYVIQVDSQRFVNGVKIIEELLCPPISRSKCFFVSNI